MKDKGASSMLEMFRRRALRGAAPIAIAMVLASAASPVALAQKSEAPAAAKAAVAAQASMFSLDNGIRVVVVPDHRVPVVTHMVWYAVGAADEADDEHGVAHYLEHMMFKGTAAFPKGQFDRFVIGRGGSHNATTSMDDTIYYQRLPKSALAKMMAMEADRMTGLRIDDADVASERAVVLEEYRRGETQISAELDKKVRTALYGADPRARTVIGSEAEIRALSGKTAQRFYDRFYGPSRATVVIAGDVTEAEARKLAAETYAKVPARDGLAPRVASRIVHGGSNQRIEVAHERATTVRVNRIYLVPQGPRLTRQESSAANLFAYVAGGGLTSRMHVRLVNEAQLATAVNCGLSYHPQASLLDCSAVGRVGVGAAELEKAFESVLAGLAEGGISDAEFDEIKSRFLATAAFRKDNVYDRAFSYGNGLAKGRSLAEVEALETDVADLTRADLDRVGREILRHGRHVTGVMTPKPAADPVAKTSAAN